MSITRTPKMRRSRTTTPGSPLRDLQVLVQHLWDCPRHPEGCEVGDGLFEARTRLDAALSSPLSTVKEREADEEV